MKVLVTGANGFIGSQVCRVLLRRGHTAIALVHRHKERLEEMPPHPGLHLETGDIMDRARVEEILVQHSPEGVCHLAVQPPQVEDAGTDRRVNIQGTLFLLEVCRRRGISRLVYASSMSVYNFQAPAYLPVDEEHPLEPLQKYGREKRQGEVYCQDYAAKGMHIPILRYSGVYGPGKRQGAVYNFICATLQREDIEIPLNRRIDLVYVQDVATVTVTALERAEKVGREVFNIGAGRSVALGELAGVISQEIIARVGLEIRAEGNEFYLDIKRARNALDYAPRSLSAGVADYIRWVKRIKG